MMETLFGIFMVILGLAQAYFSKNYFVQLKTHGGASTPPFVGLAIAFSFFFAFLLICLGLSETFNWM